MSVYANTDKRKNTKTSTTHSHVSKKHCTGTGRILRSHLKRTTQAGFHIFLIQQLGCTVCCHVRVLRNLQAQLAHTVCPKVRLLNQSSHRYTSMQFNQRVPTCVAVLSNSTAPAAALPLLFDLAQRLVVSGHTSTQTCVH